MTASDKPGYRRRFRIGTRPGWVGSELEDDFHHMQVEISYDGRTITGVRANMIRAPWNTCPGAEAVLVKACTGKDLQEVSSWGEKTANCTHLYDLALLASSHFEDSGPLVIDIAVSDPDENGVSEASLHNNGVLTLSWRVQRSHMLEPEQVKGVRLDKLGSWIKQLPGEQQEPARLLRWAIMVAHGRLIPMSEQSDATRMPPNCYSFQPERAAVAVRTGKIFDFSSGGKKPLEHEWNHNDNQH